MTLSVHSHPDLRSIRDDVHDSSPISPGEYVYHVDDQSSFGICVSRNLGAIDLPWQCSVVWSKKPQLGRSQWWPNLSGVLKPGVDIDDATLQKSVISQQLDYRSNRVIEKRSRIDQREIDRLVRQGGTVHMRRDGTVDVEYRLDPDKD